MASSYAEVKALHASSTPFEPLISPSAMPFVALFSLSIALALAFIFTTLPTTKFPLAQISTSVIASALTGVGVVALFCTVGVYV